MNIDGFASAEPLRQILKDNDEDNEEDKYKDNDEARYGEKDKDKSTSR